jgi:pimeloyl-ACP methyl ester carboxylesterase
MIHCSLAQSGQWSGMARHLSDALTMTAFDLPGHGRSAPWDGVHEIQGVCTGIAAAFAARLAPAGPVDVIGHSFGATVGLRLALEHPALVRSLTLIESVLFAAAPDAATARDVAFEAAMRAGDMDGAARAFTALWGAGDAWNDIDPARRDRMAVQMPLIAAAAPALYDDAGGILHAGRLEAMQAPTLLIEGGRSPAVIHEINGVLAKRIPHARRAVIGGAVHMAPVTHPGAVSAEVAKFLAG